MNGHPYTHAEAAALIHGACELADQREAESLGRFTLRRQLASAWGEAIADAARRADAQHRLDAALRQKESYR